jgi:hypothetical protein
MSDPNPSDFISRANETFVETYARLEKEARASEISRPLTIIFYPLVGSRYQFGAKLKAAPNEEYRRGLALLATS